VEVTLVDDRTLRRLHRVFLGDPRPTDVMAFDYRRERGPTGPGAELVVSAERALREARKRRHPSLEELALYVAHGCLHLCGFRDARPAEAGRMREAEAAALAQAGFPSRFFPGGDL
jgi:probable rRNA maturation factor